MDKRERYRQKVMHNADTDIGPWLGLTILKDSIKRSRMNSWHFDIDKPYLLELWAAQKGKCAVSGIAMQTQSGSQQNKNPFRASLDRIDNDKGYVKGNVRFVTHWINNAKSTWTEEIFSEFVQGAYKFSIKKSKKGTTNG